MLPIFILDQIYSREQRLSVDYRSIIVSNITQGGRGHYYQHF